MFKPIIFILLLWIESIAHAGFIAGYLHQTQNSFDTPTHIIVAGVGMELGTQLQSAAVSKAKKYHDLYPDHQIFVLSHKEDGTSDRPLDNASLLKRWGVNVTYSSNNTFTDKALIDQLVPFTNIFSVDFFTHNSPHYGFQLESKFYRLAPDSPHISRLVNHFAENAYALFHGCNTGFIMAPTFSKLWKIPVAGTLTASSFEYLTLDNQFYFDGNGGGGKARTNNVSFSIPIDCSKGACVRMKPENNPYHGIWGHFDGGGLNFSKFFCVKNSLDHCQRVMALSLINNLSIRSSGLNLSDADFYDLLFDHLCTSANQGAHRNLCRQNLIEYEKTFVIGPNGFQGKQIQCDFQKCLAKVECDSKDGVLLHGTCKVKNQWTKPVDTLEREFLAYLRGWELIKSQQVH